MGNETSVPSVSSSPDNNHRARNTGIQDCILCHQLLSHPRPTLTITSHSETLTHAHILRRFALWTRSEKLTFSSTDIWVRGILQKQHIKVTNKIWDANGRPLNCPLFGYSLLSNTRRAPTSRHPCGLCVVVMAKRAERHPAASCQLLFLELALSLLATYAKERCLGLILGYSYNDNSEQQLQMENLPFKQFTGLIVILCLKFEQNMLVPYNAIQETNACLYRYPTPNKLRGT